MASPRPIVFLPGVMGSRLYFPDADRYWDPDSTRQMLWWAPLWPVRSDDDNRQALHVTRPAGVLVTPLDDQVTPAQAARGWGGVVWSYYDKLANALESSAPGRGVFAVGYDWRRTIRWLGWYAGQRIQKVLDSTGATEFSVITHSMGGLVLRAAFLTNPDLAARAYRVVHVCQPSVGAVILYRRLYTGLLQPYDGGGGIADRAFRLILGNTRTAFLGNMSGLPGPMQLLPSPHYPRADGVGWNPLLPPLTPYTPGAGGPPAIGANGLAPAVAADLAARVADVNDFHTWLGAPADPALAGKTWLLYGATTPTETAVRFPGGKATPVVTSAGDETVPAVSATALGLPPGQMVGFSNLRHGEACNDPGVLSTIGSIPL